MINPIDITGLASLPVATIALYFMYRLTTNHIAHSIAAVEELTAAIHTQTEVSREFYGWLHGWVERDKRNGRST